MGECFKQMVNIKLKGDQKSLKSQLGPGTAAHFCNPSYLGGEGHPEQKY
jgi:hypothetical protein